MTILPLSSSTSDGLVADYKLRNHGDGGYLVYV